MSTLDLLRVWDRESSRQARASGVQAEKPALDKAEFVRMMGHFFKDAPPALWSKEVRPIAEELFEAIAGRHDKIGGVLSRKVDMYELERWLAVAGKEVGPGGARVPPDAPPPLKAVRSPFLELHG